MGRLQESLDAALKAVEVLSVVLQRASAEAGRPKGESLRQAQLAALQKHPHPYYWAAYQLTGEPR
ncbi:MAG: CHAT domain-containing protein [Candidatus Methylomirabilota bacterium]